MSAFLPALDAHGLGVPCAICETRPGACHCKTCEARIVREATPIQLGIEQGRRPKDVKAELVAHGTDTDRRRSRPERRALRPILALVLGLACVGMVEGQVSTYASSHAELVSTSSTATVTMGRVFNFSPVIELNTDYVHEQLKAKELYANSKPVSRWLEDLARRNRELGDRLNALEQRPYSTVPAAAPTIDSVICGLFFLLAALLGWRIWPLLGWDVNFSKRLPLVLLALLLAAPVAAKSRPGRVAGDGMPERARYTRPLPPEFLVGDFPIQSIETYGPTTDEFRLAPVFRTSEGVEYSIVCFRVRGDGGECWRWRMEPVRRKGR